MTINEYSGQRESRNQLVLLDVANSLGSTAVMPMVGTSTPSRLECATNNSENFVTRNAVGLNLPPSSELGSLKSAADLFVVKPALINIDDKEGTPTNLGLHDKFMKLRLAYVTAMGWRKDISTDQDTYDLDPSTSFYIKTRDSIEDNPDSPIVCGMRLTRVRSFRDSLSWHMFDGRPEIQTQIEMFNSSQLERLEIAAGKGELWDLTRLTPQIDGSVDKNEIAGAIHELIGSAIVETAIKEGTKPLWVFLTTDMFKRYLDTSGITHDVIFSGKVNPTDYEASHLCIADPVAAYNYVQSSKLTRHERTFAAATRGIRKVID